MKNGLAARVGFYTDSSKFSDLREIIELRYEADQGFAAKVNLAAEALKEDRQVIYFASNYACQQVCKQKVRCVAYPGIYVEHWFDSKDYDQALNQIRKLYCTNKEFARMLNASAWNRMNGKTVYTMGKYKHVEDALEYALTEIIETKVTTETGWQWLHKRQDQKTKLFEWKKINRKEAAHLSKPYKEVPLELMQVYGYQFDNHSNAWEQAAEVEKETALPNFVVMDELWIKDNSSELDRNNPHFVNYVDDPDLQPVLTEAKRIGFEVVEVEAKPIREVHVPIYSVTHKVEKGSTESKTDYHILDELDDLYESDRDSWNTQILGFLDDFFTQKKTKENQIEHKEQLIVDGQEVENYAYIDVGSMVSLLEEQLEQTEGYAPSGVVAALSRARLESQKRARVEQILIKFSGAKDMFIGEGTSTEFLDEIEMLSHMTILESGNSPICREIGDTNGLPHTP